MSEAGMLHLFLRGEIRTDGWVSDWRKSVESRFGEEREIITAPQIKVRQAKPVYRRDTTRVLPQGAMERYRHTYEGGSIEAMTRLNISRDRALKEQS